MSLSITLAHHLCDCFLEELLSSPIKFMFFSDGAMVDNLDPTSINLTHTAHHAWTTRLAILGPDATT